MIYRILLIATLLFSMNYTVAQEDSRPEIGFDLAMGFSKNGGNFGIGPKYKFAAMNPSIAWGPSLRFQHVWANNFQTGQSTSYTIYGGGAFLHYRIENIIYLGAEVEFLHTPINFTFVSSPSWVPTAFVGGGLSKSWDFFRINAGLMYDVINHNNSPFRSSYFLSKTDGSGNKALLPLIYRFSFFFEI
ncbi:hypothetical protein [Lishizhenia sp.]|uniref:hypothetical protein n=1 Tax=Lishizhenia sp. TaxID=2497594 RepID=UPI00299EFBCF|nr:hypothetical protein [Lishizhenia sp.]MDX1447071.1 hypothetical protein [Lishizhenia sp.]